MGRPYRHACYTCSSMFPVRIKAKVHFWSRGSLYTSKERWLVHAKIKGSGCGTLMHIFGSYKIQWEVTNDKDRRVGRG